jgi:hypothetical protein
MLFDPKHEDRFDRLTEQLRLSPVLKPDHLISNVIEHACARIPAEKAARIDQLIEAGAWSDAPLALVELELPAWKLRRLVYEDGQWLCSLSKQPNLPAALDDTADASHEVLPLAILTAFVEARRRASAMRETSLHTVPQVTLRFVATTSAEQLSLLDANRLQHHQGQSPCDKPSLSRVRDLRCF